MAVTDDRLNEVRDAIQAVDDRIENLTLEAVRNGCSVYELRRIDGSAPIDQLLLAKAHLFAAEATLMNIN